MTNWQADQEEQERRREDAINGATIIALLIATITIVALAKFIFDSYIAPLLP